MKSIIIGRPSTTTPAQTEDDDEEEEEVFILNHAGKVLFSFNFRIWLNTFSQ